MAKFVDDEVMDAALNHVKNRATKAYICAGQPTTISHLQNSGVSDGKALGSVVIDSTDFTLANGDVSGRKSTFAQQTGVDIDVTGTADHLALVDNASPEKIFLVTTITSQGVTAGNTATINAFDHEIEDAA